MPNDDRSERGWRAFNGQIEGCVQCAGQISDLCPIGDVLLRAAGEAATERLKGLGEPFMEAASDIREEPGGHHAS